MLHWIIVLGTGLFGLVYFVTPKIGKKLKEKGIKGIDIHKLNKPEIPEMGGLIFVPFFILLSLLFWKIYEEKAFVFIALSTSLFFIYGIIDDLFTLGKWKKLLFSSALAFTISFCYFYFFDSSFSLLLFIALAFFTVIIGNAINVLAGFNGLEIGSGIIVLSATTIYFFLKAQEIYAYFTILTLAALFAFFFHNKYPAKIFPGDCGTMGIGGLLVGLAFFANAFSIILPLLSLHFSDALLKAITAGYFSSSEKPKSRVSKNGIIIPGEGYLSIPKVFMKTFALTEGKLVKYLLFSEIIIAILVLVVMI